MNGLLFSDCDVVFSFTFFDLPTPTGVPSERNTPKTQNAMLWDGGASFFMAE
jgi:hypothetical protein